MALRIRLAGQVGIEGETGRVDAGGLGRQGRLALAYLVTERRRPVPRSELADVLWGEELPRSWETSLRVVVSRLRSWLGTAGLDGPVTVTSEFGCYQVHLPPFVSVDVEQAGRALLAAQAALDSGDLASAAASAREAAEVGAADFLPGSTGLWVERRQLELRELRVQALELLSDAYLRQADAAGALAAAEQALAIEPLRESAHLRAMAAHAATGNRGAALRAYERCRRLLAQTLGVTPSPATEAAYLALLGQESPGLAPAPVPTGPPAPARAGAPLLSVALRLPAEVSTFVGRELEVGEVARLVRDSRLVTLVGPGGIGKTRLALQVAASVASDFADGAALVSLGEVTDPAAVAGHVLASAGLPADGGPRPLEALIDALAGRDLLLVVDNCEHVVEAAATLVETVLRAAPGLTVMATSREPLGVPGEVSWPVPSLAAADAERLFVARASEVRPGVALEASEAASVATICRRLDGIPLAIELAAARAGVLSAAEIAERLDDRFALLTAGARTAPARHQTLRAAIDWTYRALPSAQRLLLRRLAVLPGSFTLATAEELAGTGDIAPSEVLDLLSGLVRHSLVLAAPLTGGTRYRLLETIRAYAGEELDASGEAPEMRARLQAWAAALAEAAEPHLEGPEQAEWLDRLAVEHPNLRAALDADRASPEALRLATALGRFWEVRGHFEEGRRALRAVLAESDRQPPDLRARAQNVAAVLAQRQGDYAAARSRYEASLAIRRSRGDRLGAAIALHGLGNLAALERDLSQARSLYEETLAIGREVGELSLVAAALANLGWVAHAGGDFATARARYEEALALRRQQGDEHGIALLLGHLGDLAYQQGDYDAAQRLHGQSLELRSRLGDRAGRADSLATLGHLALLRGDPAGAAEALEESLALRRELGDRAALPAALCNLADLALLAGEQERAREHLEGAEAVAVAGRDQPALAHVLLHQGRLARAEGRLPEALKCYAQAREAAGPAGAEAFTAEWLEGVGATVAAAGDPEAGARLWGAADALRRAIGASVPPHEQAVHDRDADAVRAALGADAFARAWQSGHQRPLEESLSEAAAATA